MLELASLGYLGLFLAAFLAATILPFSSEIVFTAVVLSGFDLWTCVAVATAGNWLGSMSSYYLGTLGRLDWIEKYLGIKPDKLEKVQLWLKNKGALISFFVFLPVIGDVIAVALGYLRVNVYLVSIFMLLGKLIRYIVWIQIVYGVINWL